MIWLLRDFDLLGVLLRAASLSLEAMTVGGLLFLLLVAWPGGATEDQIARTRRTLRLCAAGLFFAQGASVALSVAILTGSSGFPFSSLLGTSFFRAGCVEMAACAVLVLLARRGTRAADWMAVLPAAVLLGAAVAQSHAVSRLHERALLSCLTALHHLATAAWIGAMLYLLLCLRVSATHVAAQGLARRYSAMAVVSVAVLVLSGIGMSYFYVGSWQGLYGTTYGIMIMAKSYLLLTMLLLGAGNYRLLRPRGAIAGGSGAGMRTAPSQGGFLPRLRRFSEAEIGLGLTAILAAASLTAQPPAIDTPQDQLSMHQIVQRMRWEAPRLASPSLAQLAPPTSLQTAVQDAAYSAGATSDANDRAWSEYNHHWSGLILLACGVLAFAVVVLPAGRVRQLAAQWPLLFFALAIFIVLRADPENWPLGPRPFWASFSSPDVLEHRLFAVLICGFAVFEWAVETGRWRSRRAAYVFPLLLALGGAALLTHSHGLSNVQDETLAEMSHTGIAVLGATAGWARWLQLRLPGTRTARVAGFAWPLCLALVGVVLLDYRET